MQPYHSTRHYNFFLSGIIKMYIFSHYFNCIKHAIDVSDVLVREEWLNSYQCNSYKGNFGKKVAGVAVFVKILPLILVAPLLQVHSLIY